MQETTTRKVELFDTSLRDGMQQPNLEISIPNAISLLQRMGGFGVHYAEIGFAGANQFVGDLTRALGSIDTRATKLALFGRTRGRGTKVEEWPDIQFMVRHKAARRGRSCRRQIPPAGCGSVPGDHARRKSCKWCTRPSRVCRINGLEVIVDLEHAMDAACGRRENGVPCDAEFSKRSLDYFNQITAQCVRQNVSRLVVCDTTGGAGPEEVTQVMSCLTWAYPNVKFGFHGHTDRGLGVANTRAAIFAGAAQIQGTIVGTGERCGNVNLTTVIGSMQLRGEAEFVSPDSLTGLTGLAHSVYGAFGLEVPHSAAIVGQGAFGTWAGMHGSSERKNPGAYLWCHPEKVGASAVIGVNGQSGKANIMLLSESMGIPLNAVQAQALIDTNQSMIDGGGFTASEISFRLACIRVLGTLRNSFSVKSWKVLDESDEAGNRFVRATMSLQLGDANIIETTAEGAGPVDALSKAMRKELERWYPTMKQMRLETFSVTAIDISAHDTAAHVRVTVSFQADGHEPWTTAGVSSDLNQAALMAILDGFHFWLLKHPD